MLANFTTATTDRPVRIRAVPAPGAAPGTVDVAFEVDRVTVARRVFSRTQDAVVVAACLRRPAYLHLLATEDETGHVRAILAAKLPVPEGQAEIDPVIVPLGAVERAPGERLHRGDLSAETARLLHDLAGVPVSEALARAVDALLQSL